MENRSLDKGNLVNWETAEWDLVNMTEISATLDSVCLPIRYVLKASL